MITEKKQMGDSGELIARNFITSLKYNIRDTNWRYGHLEIDIIAENADFIIFCEVKTRSSKVFQEPYEAVNLQKQRNMIKAANHYMNKHNLKKEVRFDIISIVLQNNSPQIEHIPAAFSPRW
ncbi:MAG: YraN family protein [Bacteroidales bacterium]|jgi:putative endonuclease|nr:YraN family protein [Bacteroidales bacterium]